LVKLARPDDQGGRVLLALLPERQKPLETAR
jgi:hypothetical protein